ncbi:MAG: YdcH family protein [Gammaproteobacteria bacterium]|nr:YdcH family protein [Gammaproteobacteria bacterium]
MTDNIETNTFGNLSRLKELRVAHRNLDKAIDELAENPDTDQVRIKRLKKQKLLIKDMIVRIESELIPDLNA